MTPKSTVCSGGGEACSGCRRRGNRRTLEPQHVAVQGARTAEQQPSVAEASCRLLSRLGRPQL